MLRIFWNVVLLLVTTVSLCGAQTPKGQLIEQADGSYDYIVDKDDRVGQWGIAFGDPTLWQELKKINPQLKDPDLIRPGDRLNVPPSMLRLFQFMVGSHNLATTTTDTIVDTVLVPATASSKPEMSDWLLLFIILTIGLIMYRLGHFRTKSDDESRRKREDPYYGINQVEGGLPTVESAVAYFTNMYENERLAMSVQEAQHEPPQVHIVRIVPVDVRGPMWISYGNSANPVEKNIPDWVPAWQCFLDDGSYRLSLMVCGNDVRSGLGMTPLSEDQIRPRQDMKAVELNHQVWPMVSAEEKEAAELAAHLEIPSDVPRYREVRIKSATRFILLDHNGAPEKEIDVSSLGDTVHLSFSNGLIIVEVGDKRQVIGMIGEKDPLNEATDAENLSLINAGPPTTANQHDSAGVVD